MGDLPWLPPGMRQTFYSATLNARLISLNYMCLSARTLFYNVPSRHCLVIMVDGRHFVTCQRSVNNLFPLPHAGRGQFYPFPALPSVTPAVVTPVPPSLPRGQPVVAYSAPFALRNFTKEQLGRCDRVEYLLDLYCRPSDESLSDSIKFGALGDFGTGLTPSDVHLNRLLRGPDVYRAQARVRDPPALPSMSFPAQAPCWTLVVDQHNLSRSDCFGNSCKLNIVCEFTGAFWVVPSKTGSAKNIQLAMTTFIHSQCNAFGHRVNTIHADAHSVFGTMVEYFGSLSIKLLLAPPGHHAKRIERYTQTFNERRRMLDCSLPYLVPEDLGLSIFADKHVAYAMRDLVNTQSHPNTPHELILRERTAHYKAAPLRFQEIVAIRMGENKRRALAHHWMVPLQRVPIQEIGMCLGRTETHTRGAYYIYVHSTRQVLIRRHFTRVPNVVPSFCVPNPSYIRTATPYDYSSPLPSPTHSGTLNAPVQAPLPMSSLPHSASAGDDILPASHIPSLESHSLPDRVEEVNDQSVVPPLSTPRSDYNDATLSTTQGAPNVVAPPTTPPLRSAPLVTPSTDGDRSAVATLDFTHIDPVDSPTPVDNTPQICPSSSRHTPSATEEVPQLTESPQHVSTRKPSSPTKKKPSPPVNSRVSLRSNKGQNRHLRFDNSWTQPAAKLASHTFNRHYRFTEPTWADVLNPDTAAVPVLPPSDYRAFQAAILDHRASVTKLAGSRRCSGYRVRQPHPATPCLPHVLRHMCFLLAMVNANHALATTIRTLSPTPDLVAFSATPVVDVDLPSSLPTAPALAFTPKANKEMTYKKAAQKLLPEEIRAAVLAELTKLFDTHKAIRPINPGDIPPDAVRIYSSMLLKVKYFGDGTFDKVSARLAAGGNTQPDGSFGDTYAPTADESSTLCAFASFAAHAVKYQYTSTLCCSNFDVKGAFLWVPRTNPTPIIMRLPSYIDHPLAGQDVEVLKSIYGLKDSNANFDADLRATILSAGFRATVDPCI